MDHHLRRYRRLLGLLTFVGLALGVALVRSHFGGFTLAAPMPIQDFLQGANPSIEKVASSRLARPGEFITYTLTYLNEGDSPAGGVVITESIPAAITNTSVSSNGPTLALRPGSTYVWDVVGDLASNAGGAITITGELRGDLQAGDIVTNTAEIASTSFDADPLNNSATARVDITRVGPGPGGVGYTDGSSNLELWLRADSGVIADGSGAVSDWLDISGNGHIAAQPFPSEQPGYQAGAINGRPALRFDYDRLSLGDLSADFPAAAYLFAVATINNDPDGYGIYVTSAVVDQCYWRYSDGTSRLAAFRSGSITDYALPADGSRIFTLESSASNYELFQNGVSSGARAPAYTAGTLHQIGYYGLQGDIAEIILFNTVLTDVKRTHVELYLNDTYSVTLHGTGIYTSSTHNQDVMGISRSANLLSTRQTGGMAFVDAGFLQEVDDVLVFGHDGGTNVYTTDDVPGGVLKRWSRTWRIHKNDAGSLGGDVAVVFDFSEAGMAGSFVSQNPARYYLLQRNSATGQLFVMMQATSVAGDQVTFAGVNPMFLDLYVTLGDDIVISNVFLPLTLRND